MTTEISTAAQDTSPAELRSRFGANLRYLSRKSTSISALCRDLGINRTQFNRYLTGESFPRPDVLHKICSYFGVDARILLEPVESVLPHEDAMPMAPELAGFTGRAGPPDETALPSGFYRFCRRSFLHDDRFLLGIVYIYRSNGLAVLRGYEARDAMAGQGLDTHPRAREFRGMVQSLDEGVMIVVSRRGGTTASFNYLARVPTFANNYWLGYTARPVREGVAGHRFERLVYEYLGQGATSALRAARNAGYHGVDDLLPYHRTLLAPDTPIT